MCSCSSPLEHMSRQLKYMLHYRIYYAPQYRSHELAYILDSLVRVSRRAEQHVLSNNCNSPSTYMHTAHTPITRTRVMYTMSALLQITWSAHGTCTHVHSLKTAITTTYMHSYINSYIAIHTLQKFRTGVMHVLNIHASTHIMIYTHTHGNFIVCIRIVHCIAPKSQSYNYIFKFLFTTPSWYVFPIGVGHISRDRWNVAPIRIPVQRSANRLMHTVNTKNASFIWGYHPQTFGVATDLNTHIDRQHT